MKDQLLRRIYLPGNAPEGKNPGNFDPCFMEIAGELSRAFQGKTPGISTDMLFLDDLSDFALSVLREITGIPAGETRTYGEVAVGTGHPGAARAVGQVLRNNPFPLLFPCHRVVSTSGSGGYQGGPEMKRFLQAAERKSCAS